MLYITNHQGNTNQNHNEILPHTLSEWLLTKRQQIIDVGKDVEKKEPWYTVGGNVNWCRHYGKQYGGSSKNLKNQYYMIYQFHFWVYIWRKWKHPFEKLYVGFPGGAVVENLPANAGDMGSSPGLGRSHMLQSN